MKGCIIHNNICKMSLSVVKVLLSFSFRRTIWTVSSYILGLYYARESHGFSHLLECLELTYSAEYMQNLLCVKIDSFNINNGF